MDLKNKNQLDFSSKNEEKDHNQKSSDYSNKTGTVLPIEEIALLIIITSGLINTEYFYNLPSTAYYGFCITALVFAITPPIYI